MNFDRIKEFDSLIILCMLSAFLGVLAGGCIESTRKEPSRPRVVMPPDMVVELTTEKNHNHIKEIPGGLARPREVMCPLCGEPAELIKIDPAGYDYDCKNHEIWVRNNGTLGWCRPKKPF